MGENPAPTLSTLLLAAIGYILTVGYRSGTAIGPVDPWCSLKTRAIGNLKTSPSRAVSCPAWFPHWVFWGKYQLNCDKSVFTKPDTSQQTNNHNEWGLVIPTKGHNGTGQNRACTPNTPRSKDNSSTKNYTFDLLAFWTLWYSVYHRPSQQTLSRTHRME
ncbi:hypothetical protein CHARACLAT_033132 [Characodon lateralis]|uniref:Secreted protein n=1 Tax=Characodon lateralis TaxID=208331 RepID=A0ABU7EI42_9TELE|nr:hypothetical protein [Characodon lateralis]